MNQGANATLPAAAHQMDAGAADLDLRALEAGE
jgi:hypothetical protein